MINVWNYFNIKRNVICTFIIITITIDHCIFIKKIITYILYIDFTRKIQYPV